VDRHPPLNKRRLFVYDRYTIYSVDPLGVRDSSQEDEEFGNFAIHPDFPRLIPEREIWLSNRAAEAEGVFFVANALAQLCEQKGGAPPEKAHEAGLNVER
jgi:hypothetical protein